MPVYEYRCDACGKRSSSLLKSYAAPDPPCPHCGSARVTRLVSTFATARSESEDLSGFDDLGESEADQGEMGGWDGGGLDDF